MAESIGLVPKTLPKRYRFHVFQKNYLLKAYTSIVMGSPNWLEARLLYCANESVSYDMLAKRYKVAKSTITRRAAREHWPQLRQEYQDEKLRKLLKKNMNNQIEVEERQLKSLRIAIATEHNVIVRIAQKTAAGTETAQDMRKLSAASDALYKSIMMERTILRLPTKPVKLKSPEDIEEYKAMMGLTEPPVDKQYRETKEAIESLDRMIERQKMLQSMIDETNKRGAF